MLGFELLIALAVTMAVTTGKSLTLFRPLFLPV